MIDRPKAGPPVPRRGLAFETQIMAASASRPIRKNDTDVIGDHPGASVGLALCHMAVREKRSAASCMGLVDRDKYMSNRTFKQSKERSRTDRIAAKDGLLMVEPAPRESPEEQGHVPNAARHTAHAAHQADCRE